MTQELRWIVATTLGLALTGFAFHFPGSFPSNFGFDWDVSAAAFGAALGAISGVIVGSVQALFRVASLRSAVLTMAVGIGVSHALADGAPFTFGLAPIAIISAIVLTGVLSLTYGDRRPVVVAASFVGWAGGWIAADAVSGVLGLPWTDDPIGWSTEHTIVGIVHGLVWAGLTAAAGFRGVSSKGNLAGIQHAQM